MGEPDFCNDHEKAQAVLRERKRADDQIAGETKLNSLVGDNDTYINLAQEETNAAQREELLKDLDRELNNADTYISELETRTLLAGETDHLNAIMTIKPRAGRTESQAGASIFIHIQLGWAWSKR